MKSISKFLFILLQPVVIPVVQKLPKRLAWVVARHGFGVLPIVDQAHYGRGLYFTTSLNYLVALTTPAASTIPATPSEQHQNDDEQVFLLSLVVPGNAFPIVSQKGPETDQLIGKPARPGYQSHYTVAAATAPTSSAQEGSHRDAEVQGG